MRVPRLITRSFAAIGVAALALVTQSCGDVAPTAPPVSRVEATANLDLLGDALSTVSKTLAFLSCKKLDAASATATIGKAGGFIQVGPHSLYVPSGALNSPVTITATSPTDNIARVSFEPHGLKFQKQVTLTMSYAHCNTLGSLAPKRIAYVDDDLNLLYFLPSLDNLFAKTVTSKLDHFSDYALSW